jgi:hypothetical protein
VQKGDEEGRAEREWRGEKRNDDMTYEGCKAWEKKVRKRGGSEVVMFMVQSEKL